jgi:hypothetical protein
MVSTARFAHARVSTAVQNNIHPLHTEHEQRARVTVEKHRHVKYFPAKPKSLLCSTDAHTFCC